jgi:hypothetical protein
MQLYPCPHPIIILPPEVRHSDMEKLLHFIYQGEVNVLQENLARFLKTAEMLKIKGLADDSEKVRSNFGVRFIEVFCVLTKLAKVLVAA